ncbi:ankyrin repeat domain-containing protein [Mitsuaria sp. WAJ17]|uniref:ankyrin repeat domain-containing protein n=1 Tax=Mitsuaria sp. WAJ17 TaxID=2761452 RepID=UPI0016032E3F|nr:ankyrin repeat domain-containing protein [Mitsuaria sp. WAJ17]MBB2488079.1 ankyrin repeat domain-containing protein [Mitsuaria sp. WAJ17]
MAAHRIVRMIGGIACLLTLASAGAQAPAPGPVKAAALSAAERKGCDALLAEAPTRMVAARPSSDALLRLVAEQTDAAVLRRQLLGQDLDRTRGTQGLTLLDLAAGVGNHAAVRVLLELGARVPSKSASGDTALDHAILQGQAATACLLMQQGASLSDARQKPYLLPAALLTERSAHADWLTGALLARGFDANAAMSGDPALLLAAELGHEGALRRLLLAGADPRRSNARGESLQQVAVRGGHEALLRRVLAANPSQ